MSKNTILLKAIEHISQLKLKLGESLFNEVEMELSEEELSPETNPKKKRKIKDKREQKDGKIAAINGKKVRIL